MIELTTEFVQNMLLKGPIGIMALLFFALVVLMCVGGIGLVFKACFTGIVEEIERKVDERS